MLDATQISDQSYKACTIIFYDSRLVKYDLGGFIRLATEYWYKYQGCFSTSLIHGAIRLEGFPDNFPIQQQT